MIDGVAELVRKVVRRGDYLLRFPTLSALLEDPEEARDFLASYLRKRKDFSEKLLRPQYQCLSSRMSANQVKLQRGMVLNAD